jgi:cardiolipin synthase A/B
MREQLVASYLRGHAALVTGCMTVEGVDVRLLLAGPRTDVRLVRTAGRARYPRLLAAGVRIFDWQPTTLHFKTFVVDG